MFAVIKFHMSQKMLVYNRTIFLTSSEILGHVQQSSVNFGKCLETFVQPSNSYQKIFENFRESFENFRKIA